MPPVAWEVAAGAHGVADGRSGSVLHLGRAHRSVKRALRVGLLGCRIVSGAFTRRALLLLSLDFNFTAPAT
jgi:hypothetical protein